MPKLLKKIIPSVLCAALSALTTSPSYAQSYTRCGWGTVSTITLRQPGDDQPAFFVNLQNMLPTSNSKYGKQNPISMKQEIYVAMDGGQPNQYGDMLDTLSAAYLSGSSVSIYTSSNCSDPSRNYIVTICSTTTGPCAKEKKEQN